jgi:hypothetical protein
VTRGEADSTNSLGRPGSNMRDWVATLVVHSTWEERILHRELGGHRERGEEKGTETDRMSVPHAGLRGHVEKSLYTAGGMEEAEMRRLRIEDEEPRGSKRKEEEQN